MCGVLLFVYAQILVCSVCFYAFCDCGKAFKKVVIVVFSGEEQAGRLEDDPVVLLYSVSCSCIIYSYFYKAKGRAIFTEMKKYKRHIVMYKEQIAD